MAPVTVRILVALGMYAAATLVSVAFFRGSGLGLVVDGALLIGFLYYLSTLRRAGGA